MNPCPVCGQTHHRRTGQAERPESVWAALFVGVLIVVAFWLAIAVVTA